MPHDVCPVALATKYARVANNLFAAWGKPAECRHYFNELTSDRRGGREGFPQDVIRDLEVLRAWHDELHPSTENQRTWEQLQAVGIDRT